MSNHNTNVISLSRPRYHMLLVGFAWELMTSKVDFTVESWLYFCQVVSSRFRVKWGHIEPPKSLPGLHLAVRYSAMTSSLNKSIHETFNVWRCFEI